MIKNKVETKEYIVLGLIGCLLGILSFLIIYGTKILIFTNDGWILNNQMDMKQHYIGWCHFRNTAWRFPIGLIDSLSEPFDMSVVYTDSVPMFAVFFKIFRAYLPVHFQYFGLFGIICYALQGALSAILLRLFSKNKIFCILGSVIFILSFPLLQRMYFHTALGAQWLIIWALILWFSLDLNDIKKSCIWWGILGFLCVGIHSYFVFMNGIILLLSVIEYYLTNKKVKESILPIVSFCVISFIHLYILGGFYGESTVSGYGFGLFNANITALINPIEYSRFFNEIPMFNSFEYEGFAYLGAGIFLLIAGILILVALKKISIKSSLRKIIIIGGVLFSSFISMFPNFDLGGIKLIHIPLPAFIKSILGICRTNGRFMWIAYYLIILSVLVIIEPYFNDYIKTIILSIVVLLQLFDISNMAKSKFQEVNRVERFSSVWTQFESMKLFNNKKRFVFLYNDSDLMMDTAFYGYLNDMSQNIYYYARPIDEVFNAQIDKIKGELSNKNIDSEAIYILRNEDMDDEVVSALNNCGAVEYYFDGHHVYSMQ